MAFIHCSLTVTALSWSTRLNDTYEQDWHSIVQAFKNHPFHKKRLLRTN